MTFDISSERLVIRPWIGDHNGGSPRLTLKMQSVLFSALRGCDTVSKEDPSKSLVRAIRSVILRDAEEGQRGHTSIFLDGDLSSENLTRFTDDLDHYPVHFVMHLAHACEIIGYKHPDHGIREPFLRAYNAIVEALHVLPESPDHLNVRLADAIYGDNERQRYRQLTIRRTEIAWRVPRFRLLVARCLARLLFANQLGLSPVESGALFASHIAYEDSAAVKPITPDHRGMATVMWRNGQDGYRD